MTPSWRYVLAWMGCFGLMNVYFCRINLSMAMVAMVGVDPPGPANSSCGMSGKGEERVGRVGEFNWTKPEQGLVTGSYFWGYTACQVPAAWLASRFGFRWVFGFSMLMASFLTIVFPVAARTSVHFALAARILLGVFHASAFPAMTGAWGAWAPPLERTKLNGLAVNGACLGTLVIFSLSGYIAEHLGWAAIFYVTGASSLVWVVLWFFLVADTPSKHPYISNEEKKHIEESLGLGEGGNVSRPKRVIPWTKILLSPQVWGIVLGHAASNWGNYTLNQQLPTYLGNVLRFSLSVNGLLASFCFLIQSIVCVSAAIVTDWIRARGFMSTIRVRKLNTFLGMWVSAAAAVLAVYAACEAELAVFLFAIAAGCFAVSAAGCKCSMLDIAPDYAGIVFGISNTVGNIPGFIAPTVVGFLLDDYGNRFQWQAVFWISGLVQIVGSLLFLWKGSDQIQTWAKPQHPLT